MPLIDCCLGIVLKHQVRISSTFSMFNVRYIKLVCRKVCENGAIGQAIIMIMCFK